MPAGLGFRQGQDAIERQLAHQEANEIRGAYTHAADFWQERRADDAVVDGRVRPAKGGAVVSSK